MLRTPQMNLPPWARGRTALGMTAAAAEGRFELQVCERCAAAQYPPRDACHRCLSGRLESKTTNEARQKKIADIVDFHVRSVSWKS